MKASKKKQLEAAGWKVGSTSEFLELSDAEEMLVNMKLALAANVRKMRQDMGMTQLELAKRIKSSQSRIAKMEVADGSVSMELFVRSLAALGASCTQIGKIVGTRTVKEKRTAAGKKRSTAKVRSQSTPRSKRS
jgi:predicted transcriptional regulator